MCNHNLLKRYTTGILICAFCGLIFKEIMEENKPPEHTPENPINTNIHFSNMSVDSSASIISPYMNNPKF